MRVQVSPPERYTVFALMQQMMPQGVVTAAVRMIVVQWLVSLGAHHLEGYWYHIAMHLSGRIVTTSWLRKQGSFRTLPKFTFPGHEKTCFNRN